MTRPRRRPAALRRWLLAAVLPALWTACADATGPGADDGTDDGTPVTPTGTTVEPVSYTVAAALAKNQAAHDVAGDYSWNGAAVVPITFSGSAIAVQGSGAKVNGRTVTVTAAGTYSFTGQLTDGRIIVDTDAAGVVRLILNGVTISSASNSPLTVENAERVLIVLADNSVNQITDAAAYSLPSGETEPNAALFSRADLTLYGNGSLTVKGNYNDGIASKDGLVIKSGNITVTAKDDGIRGKDYVMAAGGNIVVTAGGDGIKADNEDEANAGYIHIAGGNVTVTAGADGLEAETDLLIAGGSLNIAAGGGSSRTVATGASAKALKATVLLVVEDGSFVIDAADDAVHANEYLSINGGSFDIATGDDGVHADSALGVNGGRITITKSYEGIESHAVVVSGGTIVATCTDDCLNAASGDGAIMGPPGGPGGPGGGGTVGKNFLHVRGGYIAATAGGDGLDVNGSIVMTGGTIIVNGPTRQDNGAVDYDGTFNMSGGFLAAAGSVGMAQGPSATSTQYSLLLNSTTARPAGTILHIQTTAGEDVLTFKPSKQYQSVAFSSSVLKKGGTYQLYVGGSSTGSATDGVYAGGAYTPGSKVGEFTISATATRVTF
ncbi:MAG: carbohydrate-binding domain-containing protein [Gemmatimonadetes bacterium]|nr:carbohydrate-binding domain-containing protein [Gemmatimonadota bacterium]